MNYPHCTGPCQQGDKPCPCPLACEREDSIPDITVLGLVVRMIIIALAFVGLGAIVGGLS